MNNIRFNKTKIQSIDDVKEFFNFLYYELKLNFHPDDPFEWYINVDTHKPSFTPEECLFYDNLMDQCFEVCKANGADIYEIGIEICKMFM